MQRSNSAFYVMAAVLLTAASFLYTWKFIVPSYQKNLEGIARANKEISMAKSKLESLDNTKNSLDQLGDVVNRLFLAVPADKDTPNLITELEAIAAKSKTTIPSIQVTDPKSVAAADGSTATASSAPTSSAVSVSFSVSGSFENLSQIISTLENDIRFTNIKTFTISETPDTKSTSLAVEAEVYRRNDPVATVAATAAPSVSTKEAQ